jgi:hypothetical protein
LGVCTALFLTMTDYGGIRKLASELLDGSTASKRREAGVELSNQLSQPDIRRRLAKAATPRDAKSPRQGRHANLSELWRYVMMCAVLSIETLRGKLKVAKGDIFLMRKLLEACSDVYRDKEELSSRLHLPPSPYLLREDIRKIFALCMELFDDRSVLDVAEDEMLQWLIHMCSRPEFVNHLKPYPEMMMILEEVKIRILPSPEDADKPTSENCVTQAATVFHKLLKTATDEHIGLHTLFPVCIKMVSRWCKKNMSSSAHRNSLRDGSLLLAGLVCLMRSNPEHAIQPLTRHGAVILTYAKKMYSVAGYAEQTVLNDYLACHM